MALLYATVHSSSRISKLTRLIFIFASLGLGGRYGFLQLFLFKGLKIIGIENEVSTYFLVTYFAVFYPPSYLNIFLAHDKSFHVDQSNKIKCRTR